jgi:hypothetical protein
VNTHIDFNSYGYQNLATMESAINYLGIKNLRDSATNPNDLGSGGKWQQIANATGAKFDAYLPESSPSNDIASLNYAKQLASQHIINFFEGGNENDNPDAVSQGNSIAWTAKFQQQVYSAAHSFGLQAINMSFGSGWTAANNWQGDYAKAGNLSAYADYGNAHTYPQPGQTTDSTIQRINGLAKLAAGSRPVITTEMGWKGGTFSQTDIARFAVDAVFDGIKNGDAKMYFYSLFDDSSGPYGLMNQNGTARPVGTALHNLTTIMADSGAARNGSLTFGLSGTTAADHSLLTEKSTGVFQIALWNEQDAAHNVTLNLASAAKTIRIYNPMTGSSAVQTFSNASNVTVNVPNHPVIVEVVPNGVTATASVATMSTTAAPLTSSTLAASTTTTPTTTTPTTTTPTTTTTGTTPHVINGTDGDHLVVQGGTNTVNLLGSHGSITATAGTNTLSTNGTGNTITGGSGTDRIEAFAGGNTLKAGSGTETINFAGPNNVVYVGSGHDTLNDGGSKSTIVFGKAGSGTADIFGAVLTNGDLLDFRTTLASTSWNHDPAKLGNYLKVGASGNDAVISVDPSGLAGGATQQLAVLHNSGPLTVAGLLAHSIAT